MVTRLLSRREAIARFAALPLIALPIACSRYDGQIRYVGACRDIDGGFGLRELDGELATISEQRLPARGHSIIVSPSGDYIVAPARRPGTYLATYNTANRIYQSVQCREGRHFYGHGCFSDDGRLLFTSENDYDNGRGVIGVRDVENGFKQITEWPTQGVGPHEIILMSDKRTLVIANGGIQTHPDSYREKLNLSSMKSDLIFLDTHTGAIIARHALPDKYQLLSIRHLAEARENTLCFAMQYQGSRFDSVPLVGFCNKASGIDLRFADEPIQRRMRNYCGAVASDLSGSLAAVSAPRGGVVTFWDVIQRKCVGSLEIPDCCGVAATDLARQFAVSSGSGELRLVSIGKDGGLSFDMEMKTNVQWDNHLSSYFT